MAAPCNSCTDASGAWPSTMSSACWNVSASIRLLHVIDLDAAMGKGSNARLVRRALPARADARARRRRHSHRGACRANSRCRSRKNHRGQRGISRRRGEPRFSREAGRRGRTPARDRRGGYRWRAHSGSRLAGKASPAAGGGLCGVGDATRPSFFAPTWTPKAPCAAPISHGSASFAAPRSCPLPPPAASAATAKCARSNASGMNAAVGMALYLNRLR